MEERMTKYLHLPLQILWFDSGEITVIVVCYLIAMIFGGLTWLVLLIGPLVLIRYKRRKGRGFFQHLLYQLGYAELIGYPLPTAKRFYE